jgi:DNA mismatch repair ATPase MutS
MINSEEYMIIDNFTENDFKFIHPFRLLIAGPTSSGKSSFVKQIILNKNKIINKEIDKIYYIYGCDQPLYDTFRDQVIFTKDLNIINQEFNNKTLIILDDLQEEITNHITELKNLIIKRSHHQNISVIIILQNIFSNSNFTKTIRINISNYYILRHSFGNDQLEVLGRQLEGYKNQKKFLDAYNLAVKTDFTGLFIDCHPLSATKIVFRYRYYHQGNILKPVFLIDTENTNIN